MSHFSFTQRLTQSLTPFYQACCLLCETNTNPTSLNLCDDCLNDLPFIQYSCPQCGTALANPITMPCGDCQKNKPHIHQTFSLFQYKKPIDYFIKQVKFHHSLIIAELIGKLMAKHISQQIIEQKIKRPKVIIPIPLHPNRLRQRGYNQALEIAKPIAKQLKIPIITDYLIRNKHTLRQTDCSIEERKKNMTNSFITTQSITYQSMVLIDDVITTGTTINEAAKVLKQSGVEQVYAWSCANTHRSS